jgi:hypothetical protein
MASKNFHMPICVLFCVQRVSVLYWLGKYERSKKLQQLTGRRGMYLGTHKAVLSTYYRRQKRLVLCNMSTNLPAVKSAICSYSVRDLRLVKLLVRQLVQNKKHHVVTLVILE